MAEFQEVMKQFDRMCSYCQREHECPMGCPMNGVNISQCRKIAFECPDSVERTVMAWAAQHPEPVYPTWGEWFVSRGMLPDKWDNLSSAYIYVGCVPNLMHTTIPADLAEKLGIEPKGEA